MAHKGSIGVDLLILTACCALWVLFATSAEVADGGWTAAVPAPESAVTEAPKAPAAGELSLFLDSDVKSTQTKPDNPELALNSGVTVSSSPASATANQEPTNELTLLRPAETSSTGRRTELQDRQLGLSFALEESGKVVDVQLPATSSLNPEVSSPAARPPAPPSDRIRSTAPILETYQASPVVEAAERPTPKPAPAKPAQAVAGKPQPPSALPTASKPLATGAPKATKPTKSITGDLPLPSNPGALSANSSQNSSPTRAGQSSAPSLREHFSGASAENEGRSIVLPPGEELVVPAQESSAATQTRIIPTQPLTAQPAAPSPTLAQEFAAGASRLGSAVPVVSPARLLGLTLLCLAMIALAVWLRSGSSQKLRFGLPRSLSVIETISLAPGRQIVLVELRGSALVLGVTAQSINLLDRMPLEMLEGNYQPTVEQIIHREGQERADWEARPKVAAMGGGAAVAPQIAPPLRSSYGPQPLGRMSVAELRQRRAGNSGAGVKTTAGEPRLGQLRITPSPRTAEFPPDLQSGSRPPKAELLKNLRDQLRKLED